MRDQCVLLTLILWGMYDTIMNRFVTGPLRHTQPCESFTRFSMSHILHLRAFHVPTSGFQLPRPHHPGKRKAGAYSH